MKPPRKFEYRNRVAYTLCISCGKWKRAHNNYFYHDGMLWNLCSFDYADYWENTDVLLPDYKEFRV